MRLAETPVATFILVNPSVQFKAIEGDALASDGDLRQTGAALGIEAVTVHAEMARGIAEAKQPREEIYKADTSATGHGGAA